MQADARTVKVVARYQQYRAVHRALERLTTGATRAQDGESDRRGGGVWAPPGPGEKPRPWGPGPGEPGPPDVGRGQGVRGNVRTHPATQLFPTAPPPRG